MWGNFFTFLLPLFFESQNASDLNPHKEFFHTDLKLLLWIRVLFIDYCVEGLVLECSDCSFKEETVAGTIQFSVSIQKIPREVLKQ